MGRIQAARHEGRQQLFVWLRRAGGNQMQGAELHGVETLSDGDARGHLHDQAAIRGEVRGQAGRAELRVMADVVHVDGEGADAGLPKAGRAGAVKKRPVEV